MDVPFDVHNEFSLIDVREFGEAGVQVLRESGHDSATYELAGPPVTLAEAVRLAGSARGVELVARTVGWAEAPLPPSVADFPSRASDMCHVAGLRPPWPARQQQRSADAARP
ncbi:hypothetical protein ACFXC8_37930 [Streptomyces sp. NPDC059441]|uniref:hypothetical protein n=1 Tax=Streptomyces sp. NPDC059441 TaxID=3346829 RepID=UPI0036C31452